LFEHEAGMNIVKTDECLIFLNICFLNEQKSTKILTKFQLQLIVSDEILMHLHEKNMQDTM